MPRTPKVPGGRTTPICTALSANEAAALDNILPGITRSEYIRQLILAAIEEHQQ